MHKDAELPLDLDQKRITATLRKHSIIVYSMSRAFAIAERNFFCSSAT